MPISMRYDSLRLPSHRQTSVSRRAPGLCPPCFDDGSRKFAVDDMEDGQVAFPFEREPGSPQESDF